MFFRILPLITLAGFLQAAYVGYDYIEDKADTHNEVILENLNPPNFHGEEVEFYTDIDSRIHELEKEAYLLEAQLELKKQEARIWENNKDRSGVLIGVGVGLDFVDSLKDLGIRIDRVNVASLVKLGYVKYFYSNFGLRVESFSIAGPTSDDYGYHFGVRFSFLQDLEVANSHYLGLALGLGLGFSNVGILALGANFHVGVSYSYSKHVRVDIERIFLPSPHPANYQNFYLVSHSFVF